MVSGGRQMRRKQILTNSAMTVVQIIIIAAVLFILYRFLLNTIGVKQFGIWSLVLSTASVTSIAQFGLSGSVVIFVSKYHARGEKNNVAAVIQTAAISVAVFIGIILLISYPVIKWILSLVIAEESIHLAILILPYALIAFWITAVTSTLQSGLDGLQRIDLSSILLMGGAIFHLALCFLIVPKYQLLGLAYATIAKNVFVFIFIWLFLKKRLPLPVFPNRWDKNIFQEIFRYGLRFQVISVAQMLYDPVTKMLISKFGGLATVGFYEMASKLILQARSLMVSANRVLVPTYAEFKEKLPREINNLYLTSYRLIFYLSVPLFTLLIILMPIISEAWIGHYEGVFVVFGILLAVGWLLNLLNAPSYYAYCGIGDLKWNVIGNITIAVLNAGLGILLGSLFGGIGVMFAFVAALTFGSSIFCVSYHRKYKISFREVIPSASKGLVIICLSLLLVFFLLPPGISRPVFPVGILLIGVAVSAILITMWLHPMRKQLFGWIKNDLFLNRKTKYQGG